MTKKQKKEHIEKLTKTVLSHDFVIDRWGNYIKKTEKYVFRFKFMKNNLRFEWKHNQPKAVWFNIFSKPIIKIDFEFLDWYINERIVSFKGL